MSPIELETLGHEYKIKEPRGNAAMELHGAAMEAMFARGAMDAFLRMGEAETDAERGQLTVSVAWRVAASPAGRAATKATLIGSTVDGEKITKANYAAIYADGRHVEPYLVALEAWTGFRFFTVTGASKSEPEIPESKPDGDGQKLAHSGSV